MATKKRKKEGKEKRANYYTNWKLSLHRMASSLILYREEKASENKGGNARSFLKHRDRLRR